MLNTVEPKGKVENTFFIGMNGRKERERLIERMKKKEKRDRDEKTRYN